MVKREGKRRPQVIFCTFSNLANPSFGDSVNDSKVIAAIAYGYNVKKIFPERGNDNRLTFPSIFRMILKQIREALTPRKVFVCRATKSPLIPILFKKIMGHKVVIYLGCTPFMYLEKQAFKRNPEFVYRSGIIPKIFDFLERIIERFTVNNADYIICENTRVKKILIKNGVKPDIIKIFPYYVQKEFMETNNPDYNDKEIMEIGYTGRFKEYDLLEPVIRAISILKKKGYNVRLNLLGDGPTRPKMEELVNRLGLKDNVIFWGAIPHSEMARKLDKFHCLVLPMLNEINPSTIAIKILEGVMKGKVIITTDSGANKTLFTPYYDLILKKPTPEEIASKIELVLKDYRKYRNIAEKIRNNHLKYRTIENWRYNIKKLLDECYGYDLRPYKKKRRTEDKLEVLIITAGNRIENVKKVILPAEYPNVKYIISHQIFDEKLPEHPVPERKDIKYITTKSIGISKNRNNALKHATGPLCILADDDITYKREYFTRIINSFLMHPEADIITFKVKSSTPNRTFKNYPNAPFYHNIFTILNVSSIEIAFRLSSVKEKKLIFDERFGIGGRPFSAGGEENIFLADALKKGLVLLYIPEFVVEHPPLRSGINTKSDALISTLFGKYIKIFGIFGFIGAILITLKNFGRFKKQFGITKLISSINTALRYMRNELKVIYTLKNIRTLLSTTIYSILHKPYKKLRSSPINHKS